MTTVRITRQNLSDGSMLERIKKFAEVDPHQMYRTAAEMAALLDAA